MQTRGSPGAQKEPYLDNVIEPLTYATQLAQFNLKVATEKTICATMPDLYWFDDFLVIFYWLLIF